MGFMEFKISHTSSDGWIDGTFNGYKFEAKVYQTPSRFGIGGYGRVSKLFIKELCRYDRGWDQRPREDKAYLVRDLVSILESM